jgi:tetratricopeptide (TPR) repeat protein
MKTIKAIIFFAAIGPLAISCSQASDQNDINKKVKNVIKSYKKSGDRVELDKVTLALDKKIKEKPLEISFHQSKVDLLRAQRKYSAALKSLNNMLKIKPDFIEMYVYRGMLLIKLKKQRGAYRSFKKAKKLYETKLKSVEKDSVDEMGIYFNLYSLTKLMSDKESIEIFEKIKLHPVYKKAEHYKYMVKELDKKGPGQLIEEIFPGKPE